MNATNNTTPNVDSEGKKLPPIRTIGDIVKNPPRERLEVIKGILKKSSKMGFSGPSKARKTWQLMNLAISVSTGQDWLKFETVQTKVLYINLELHEDTFFSRLGSICEAMETEIVEISEGMSAWCLRGFAASYVELVPQILAEIRDRGFGLIILDPTYKILGDASENAAEDITKLMNALETIAFETGAAFVMAYHFSKGNKAQSQDGDKTSGSGVFFRDPDALVEFTPQAESDDSNNIMSAALVLRDFPPVPKFSIEWDGKALFNVSGHDPSKLKKAGGRPSSHSEKDLLDVLGNRELTATEWQEGCNEDKGISRPTFFRLKGTLEGSERVSRSNNGKYSKTSRGPKSSRSSGMPQSGFDGIWSSGGGNHSTTWSFN
jgi:hypothetical protein